MSLSGHQQRLVTAAVGLPLVAAAIFLGGWWLFAVIALVTAQGLDEFYSMVWPATPARFGRALARLGGVLLGLVLLTMAKDANWPGVLGLLLAAFWAAALVFLVSYQRRPQQADFGRAMLLIAGLVYLPLTLQLILAISPLEIVFVLLLTFATDTGAFYAGSHIGGPKIWPAISPKKTWAGSLGGLALCLAVSLGAGLGWGQAPWWAWLLLGAALNIAAQFGDFAESALKRRLSVKDSGRLLPGHGGLLDRIDSLLLVLPTYAAAQAMHTFFPTAG